MERTQRLRTVGAGSSLESEPAGWGGSQQSLIAVIAVAALVVALFAYVILRGGPEILAIVGPWVASLPSERSAQGWIAPAVAVGVLLAGGSLAAVMLAAFVKGVRNDPFRWLAPVLIAFSSVVMTRLGLERSMGPLPATLFGALTALLLLGGGVLVQVPGLAVALSGAVLLSLPVLGLVLDQAHAVHGLENLLLVRDSSSLLALLVLALTSVGVGLTAFVGRPSGGIARAAERSRDWDRHRDQLAMALERVRVAELRAASFEEHAQALQQELAQRGSYGESFAAEEAAFAAAARPGGAQRWFIAFGLVVIGASMGAVGLHMAMVRPLNDQVVSERAAASEAIEKKEGELSALRTELSGERARLNELLAIEKARVETATAEVAAAKEQLAAAAAPQEAPAAKAEAAAPSKPAVAHSAAKRAAAKRKARAAAAAKPQSSAASGSGLREAISDDPIGGLE